MGGFQKTKLNNSYLSSMKELLKNSPFETDININFKILRKQRQEVAIAPSHK